MQDKTKYDIIIGFLKGIITLCTIILVMMLTPMVKRTIYSYRQNKEHKIRAEYYKTHDYPMTTRGGYAKRDTTMNIDSLRKKIWKDLNNR